MRGITALLAAVALLLSAVCTQGQNPCGVKAVLVPSGDSVVNAPTNVYFQSASVNATDYKLIFDPYAYPLNTPVNWSISTGLTTVKLVAYNGTCTDTAVAYYFYAGHFPAKTDNTRRLYGYSNREHEATGLTAIKAGGYAFSGHRTSSSYFMEPQQGLLIKTKEAGCVEWGRKLTGVYESDIRQVREAVGGGLFILAEVDYNKQFIARLDASGNLLWAKSLVQSAGVSVIGYGMEPMPDGGVVITGTCPPMSKPTLLRLDNNGNILWQREYDYNISSGFAFSNMVFKDNYLYAGGSVSYNMSTQFDGFLMKIDYAGGQTIWTKKYTTSTSYSAINLREIISVDSTLLVNIGTFSGQTSAPTVGGYMHLDTAGQVLAAAVVTESYTANTIVGPYAMANSHLVQSGKSFYIVSNGSVSLSLQGDGSQEKMIRLDSNYNVAWLEAVGGIGSPGFYYDAPAPGDGLTMGGTDIGAAVSPNFVSTMFSITQRDSTGSNPAASCSFGKEAYQVFPLTMTAQPVQWTVNVPAYTSTSPDFPLYPFYPEMRFKCPDYVDSCSYLKVSGPQSVCNLGQDYLFLSHKNKACGQPTQWQVPAGVQTITQTDSSVTVHFPAFGRYVIYGTNPLSCVPVQDSVVIMAVSRTPPLDLGPDQYLCPQNTTVLHAGRRFLSYEWQDGSTDSLFTVTQPGQYWIKVTDSCDNIVRDTVNIFASLPIPFSVGPDRTKCNSDTMHLDAPTGFLNYSWKPAYNISSTTIQKVIVNPLMDTVYTVMAEKTPGCFAYDTIKITVNISPPVYLGRDTSFCSGDSAVLDAGAGFQQYAWSNGAASQKVTVFRAGALSVKATTAQGCNSYDTLQVVQVFSNPTVQLDKDNTLCQGAGKILQPAGSYATYIWQDGSTGPSYTVTMLGKYYVTVTDDNHCGGSDTVVINQAEPVPTGFLPADTTICTYDKLDIKANRQFDLYEWSTGAGTPDITATKAGSYWLQATDGHHCTGRDTIVIYPKDCLVGLFVPSAFSPNHDGKNDVFKPILFGIVQQYHFSIYNRWGKLVFDSRDPAKGWDGTVGGFLQDQNTFVWICAYQLEGQPAKFEKGSFLLVK